MGKALRLSQLENSTRTLYCRHSIECKTTYIKWQMYATFKNNFQDLHLEHYSSFVHARFVFCIDLHHKLKEIGLGVCLFRKYLILVSLVSSQLATFVVLQIWCNLLLALMGSWLQRDQDYVIVFDWPPPKLRPSYSCPTLLSYCTAAELQLYC